MEPRRPRRGRERAVSRGIETSAPARFRPGHQVRSFSPVAVRRRRRPLSVLPARERERERDCRRTAVRFRELPARERDELCVVPGRSSTRGRCIIPADGVGILPVVGWSGGRASGRIKFIGAVVARYREFQSPLCSELGTRGLFRSGAGGVHRRSPLRGPWSPCLSLSLRRFPS
jgi:hypothetical protein